MLAFRLVVASILSCNLVASCSENGITSLADFTFARSARAPGGQKDVRTHARYKSTGGPLSSYILGSLTLAPTIRYFIAQYYPGCDITMILMHVFGYACLHARDTVKIDLSKTVCIFNEGAHPVQNNFLRWCSCKEWTRPSLQGNKSCSCSELVCVPA